ncbi:ABC transporter ATP-binding protein [Pseudomonas fluorescens]|uniref:ABC transporter ATP-binding protein n=1 Tax=Pseudomonas fluorescens TaxID=294 RepID=UPI0019071F59|nr:ABC transporter ATP-binding protein [Pseudomonas fluorescens]MBD8093956.1 ABC transporter ATP-binding protein [Pseudomonas fluorescens]MBD8721462.1 ABC transporter ATP-binding protein [Pseudomonas fluorescens]
MSMQALLALRVARKSFAGIAVLNTLQLALQPRETVSLLGPSGCGKSTLLRIAAGLDTDFQGELRSPEGEVAFVFQEPRLMPWLTVEQNIGFSDDSHYDKAWVTQLIEEVGLTGFAQALPKALSGGMAQRVAIARGLYSRPQVLLLDEPFSAVDAFTRMKLQDLLLQLAEHHGIALLLVTHDVDEALYLSDRVLVMDNRPSSIRQELAVDLPHPRDRRDPVLAQLKAQSLTELQRAHVI